MKKSAGLRSLGWLALLFFVGGAMGDEVKEIAPGVYFYRIEDSCNAGWVIFQDYVLVIDANFPNFAKKILEEVRKTTDKPVRFVFDTHEHFDHAYGNRVFADAGAAVVAQRFCAEAIAQPAEQAAYAAWAKDQPEFLKLGLARPTVVFEDQFVFDDGTHRVELLYFGHAHTRGDAVAYLPKEKILFTGDLCVNGAYNYFGNADSEHWIEAISAIQGLDIEKVCPGHGEPASQILLETQKRFLQQIRERVQQAIDAGKSLPEIIKTVEVPSYKEWTGKPVREDQLTYVYNELTGLITPWALVNIGLKEGNSPTSQSPGWTPPKKMLTRNLDEKKLAALKLVAPNLEFINVKSDEEALAKIPEVDGAMGDIDPEMFKAAKHLRWIHSRSAGVEGYNFPELVQSPVVLTNGQGLFGPAIADHVMGMILMFSKGLAVQHERQLQSRWGRAPGLKIHDLQDKTMLILGFGGIGKEVARRAAGFGMKIIAIDPKSLDCPRYVDRVAPPQTLDELLPQADVVVCCVPHTPATNKYINAERFRRMKSTAYFINISRGGVVDQAALGEALKNKTIAGAGLDVTDPEPLPDDSPLWKLKNIIITPHLSGQTDESWHRVWLLLRENVRRFAAGLPLLNVVDKSVGY